jgi:hypothetical protein
MTSLCPFKAVLYFLCLDIKKVTKKNQGKPEPCLPVGKAPRLLLTVIIIFGVRECEAFALPTPHFTCLMEFANEMKMRFHV